MDNPPAMEYETTMMNVGWLYNEKLLLVWVITFRNSIFLSADLLLNIIELKESAFKWLETPDVSVWTNDDRPIK